MSQYEIVIRGRLGRRHELASEDARLLPGCGQTTLLAEVVDQSQLSGLLNRLRDFGDELIGPRPLPGRANVD
ncbi:MAG: hypothetical protein WB761_15660 [Solirubrobacteraceae bacterium]